MVRSDLVVALTNALERGYTLETAAKVLANSGYSPNDINDAVNFINSGLSPIAISQTQPQPRNLTQPLTQSQTLPTQTPPQLLAQPQPQTQPLPQMPNAVQKKESSILLFLLVGVFVFLIIALLLVLIFQESIAGFIKNIIG